MEPIVNTFWCIKRNDVDYFISSNVDIPVPNPTIALKFFSKQEAEDYRTRFVKNPDEYTSICVRVNIKEIHRGK